MTFTAGYTISWMGIFSNQKFGSIRIFEQNGKVLFCGKDIAKSLGYQRTADVITAHCKGVCVLPTPSNGGIQRMKFIPEGDVYRLMVHSKLPSAERFEHGCLMRCCPAALKRNRNNMRRKEKRVGGSSHLFTPGIA
jgi:prophage antirepressor-like protein